MGICQRGVEYQQVEEDCGPQALVCAGASCWGDQGSKCQLQDRLGYLRRGLYCIFLYICICMGHWRTWFNGEFGSAELVVGLDDTRGLFQFKWFHYSMIVCMCLCVHLAGPGDTELQQLCWTIRFWVTPNTEFVLFILSEFAQSYFLCMASLHIIVLQKGVKHGISAQNHFQKRRKKLFGILTTMGFLPIFLWQRIRSPCWSETKS